MKHKNGIENIILQLPKKKQKWNYPFLRLLPESLLTQKYVLQCVQLVKTAFRQCKHGCKKRRKNKEKKESGKMTGRKSNATILI
jgi:hypothetical protein